MVFRGKQTLPFLFLLLQVVLSGALSCANVKCDPDKECVELKSGSQCLEKGRKCIVCTKMVPLCACQEGEQCIVHKQTCDECAYTECVKQDEGKLPPLPLIVEPIGSHLPPIPVDIMPMQMDGIRKPPSNNEPLPMPEGILKLPSEDTSGQECLMCMQSIPECTECIAGKEKCLLVPNSCHNCAWAGCVNLEDGCLTNVPSMERLCSSCKHQGKECQLKQPDNCREPPGVRCIPRKPDVCAKCTSNQECVVSIINGIPNKQCRDKKAFHCATAQGEMSVFINIGRLINAPTIFASGRVLSVRRSRLLNREIRIHVMSTSVCRIALPAKEVKRILRVRVKILQSAIGDLGLAHSAVTMNVPKKHAFCFCIA